MKLTDVKIIGHPLLINFKHKLPVQFHTQIKGDHLFPILRKAVRDGIDRFKLIQKFYMDLGTMQNKQNANAAIIPFTYVEAPNIFL